MSMDAPDGEAAAAAIEYYRDRQNENQKYNGEMAKWILASLVLVNGGPFILLSKDVAGYAAALSSAVTYFSYGIASAIVCGFFAWLNTGMREAILGEQVDAVIAKALGRPQANGPHSHSIARGRPAIVVGSYVLSVITGFASLFFFLAGAEKLAATYKASARPLAPAAHVCCDNRSPHLG